MPYQLKNISPCVLVYNPISGHGHLDSWNAMFIAILLQKGWKLLALTPDVSALMSRLEQMGLADSSNLHVLDHSASLRSFKRTRMLSSLQRVWLWWCAYGAHYYYHRPGSETVPGMSFLAYWKKRVFQQVVPILFGLTHPKQTLFSRPLPASEGTGLGAVVDTETGYLDPEQFAIRVRAALEKSPWEPDLVFNMYMDMYRTDANNWNKFAAINKWPWAGIRFVPKDLPQEGYYELTSLRGMCFLDENICRSYQEYIPGKSFEYLPDITDASLPEQLSDFARDARQRASGRKIVFMGGSIGGQKNLARWYELVAIADPARWYFVQVGEVHRATLTEEDIAALNWAMSNPPENLLVRAEYLPDERSFNDIIRTADVIYAVYRDFRISSNMLGKAAAFEKPILVSEKYLMGERVNAYGIGKTAPEDDARQIYSALVSMGESSTLKRSFERYRNDFGIKALENHLVSFIERCIAYKPNAVEEKARSSRMLDVRIGGGDEK